jgi:hypothetical protein
MIQLTEIGRATQKIAESSGEIFSALDSAMKLIEKATSDEISKNYESALTNYKKALEQFVVAMDGME